mgnify:CR=1 FL=1
MPYITAKARKKLDSEIDNLIEKLSRDVVVDGEVNYVITRIIDALYGSGGYTIFNRAMGVIDCVAREFYRRKVASYEDKKIAENGDVYRY